MPDQYILIANHPSLLEDFAIPALFDIYPLAKAEVKDWYVLGRISDYAGTIYVERDKARSRKTALRSLVDAVTKKKNLVIFPEGGCKGRWIYKEFKSGAFDVSLQTGVPVLPVFLHYHDANTFEWLDETMPQKLFQIMKNKHNRVDYYVHDAIDPADFSEKETYAEHARQQYLKWQDEYVSGQ